MNHSPEQAATMFRDIDALLSYGLFQGVDAEKILIARNFLCQLVTDIEAKHVKREEKEDRDSNGSEASAGGMDGSGVRRKRRKNSGNKND